MNIAWESWFPGLKYGLEHLSPGPDDPSLDTPNTDCDCLPSTATGPLNSADLSSHQMKEPAFWRLFLDHPDSQGDANVDRFDVTSLSTSSSSVITPDEDSPTASLDLSNMSDETWDRFSLAEVQTGLPTSTSSTCHAEVPAMQPTITATRHTDSMLRRPIQYSIDSEWQPTPYNSTAPVPQPDLQSWAPNSTVAGAGQHSADSYSLHRTLAPAIAHQPPEHLPWESAVSREPPEIRHPNPLLFESANPHPATLAFNHSLAPDHINDGSALATNLTGHATPHIQHVPYRAPLEDPAASFHSPYHRNSLAPPPPQHLLGQQTHASDDAAWYFPSQSRAQSPFTYHAVRTSPAAHDRHHVQAARPRMHSAPLVDETADPNLIDAAERKRMGSCPTPAAPAHEQLFVHESFPSGKSDSGKTSPSRRPIQKLSHWRRPGGRTIGSHLDPAKAARTKEMREKGSCWLCALQRDQCSPGEVCDRCNKRMNTPGADTSLGCIRTKLGDLTEYFLPNLLTSMHEKRALRDFCAQHIQSWSRVTITIHLECGRELPPIQCEVCEFQPKTWELLRQQQYVTDISTGQCERQERSSPPIGMPQVEERDRRIHDGYLSSIVNEHFPKFAERCFEAEPNDFQAQLLTLMGRLSDEFMPTSDEGKHLREVLRLIVATYILGHKLTLVEETKLATLSQLSSYMPDAYAEQCSPRMANRQLKYLFAQLTRKIESDVLSKLQQSLRSGNVKRWTSAFFAILGLAMVLENTQRSIHLLTDAMSAKGDISAADAHRQADLLCRAINDWFDFITTLFRRKYTRSFNPMKSDETEKLGAPAMRFVQEVATLFWEKYDYLYQMQQSAVSGGYQARYTSRLVGRFLLSLWGNS